MTVEVTYPDGTKRVIATAVRSRDDYVEGTHDLLDGQGNLVDQVSMQHGLQLRSTGGWPIESEEGINWEIA